MDLPFHAKLVHLPMALAVLLPLLSGGLLLAIWRQWLPRRAWSLVVAGQLLLVGSGVWAMRSGEADEDRVEPFVPEAAIHQHEEAGERFVWAGGILLAVSLLPLLLRNTKASLIACAATFVGTLTVAGLGYAVGQKGGELVYHHGAAAAFATKQPASAPGGRHDDDR